MKANTGAVKNESIVANTSNATMFFVKKAIIIEAIIDRKIAQKKYNFDPNFFREGKIWSTDPSNDLG